MNEESVWETASFDLTYSVHVLVWLRDPVRVLREQRRVTRRGGHVVAHLGDYGNIVFHPPCPALARLIAALARARELPQGDGYIDSHQARRTVELFAQAGMAAMRIDGDGVDRTYTAWRTSWLTPDFGGGLVGRIYEMLMAAGHLDRRTQDEARAELEAWRADPHALSLQANYLAIGRVD